MVAGASVGNSAGLHAPGGGVGADRHTLRRGMSGRFENPAMADDAGTSRPRGSRDGREEAGPSNSEGE